MGRTAAVVYCLILTGGTVAAQAAKEERALPQWLTGLIAVVGFLFLVFVAFLVNKAWCDSSKERTVHAVKMEDWAVTNGASSDTNLDMVRSKDHDSAYENLSVDGGVGDKVTAM